MDYKLLKTLCLAHGVNGDTSEVRQVIHAELKKRGIKSYEHGFGSVYFGNNKNPKKMVVAHLDEVGFQVTHIEDNGMLRIMAAGWVFPNRLDHTIVYIRAGKNKIPGLVLHQAVLKTENLEFFDQLFIDVGVDSREEALRLGLFEGQFGSFRKDYFEQNNTVIATAIDNRLSQTVVIDMVTKHPELLKENLFVFNIDEETIDHDARGICKLYQPEAAFVLDYAPVHQAMQHGDRMTTPGNGPLVMYRGGAYAMHEKLRTFFDTKIKSHFVRGFLSPETLPNLEPSFYEENGTTVACNICIPALGYHGQGYSVRKKDIESFSKLVLEVMETPLA